MPQYRSHTTTHGRNMAGARSLWRATGMTDGDFGKPIIAIANSFTQFVPGHVHLKDLGQMVAREIEKAGGIAKEFDTIAVDDGIAMGSDRWWRARSKRPAASPRNLTQLPWMMESPWGMTDGGARDRKGRRHRQGI